MIKKVCLNLVGLPIGNPLDLSFQAAAILRNGDRFIVEEMKPFKKFLAGFNRTYRQFLEENDVLSPPSKENFFSDRHFNFLLEINENKSQGEIREILSAMEQSAQEKIIATAPLNVIYASGNGLPFIADPGGKVAQVAAQLDWEIKIYSGPSAITQALGYLSTEIDGFHFNGFLPRKTEERPIVLAQWAKEASLSIPVIFLETPYRFPKLFQELKKVLRNDYWILWAYEMTTPQQRIWHGTINQLNKTFPDGFPKGNAAVILLGFK
jgi:16S rRNA (cytidine1402-2'-O)-methyltransferase